MKIIKVQEYDINGTLEIALCGNKQGDTVVGDIYIDVLTDSTITAEGSMANANYQSIKVVDMSNYTIKDSMSKGYYLIPASGLESIKLMADSASIVIKTTF